MIACNPSSTAIGIGDLASRVVDAAFLGWEPARDTQPRAQSTPLVPGRYAPYPTPDVRRARCVLSRGGRHELSATQLALYGDGGIESTAMRASRAGTPLAPVPAMLRAAFVLSTMLVACQDLPSVPEYHPRPELELEPECPVSRDSALERGQWVKVYESNSPYGERSAVCIVR